MLSLIAQLIWSSFILNFFGLFSSSLVQELIRKGGSGYFFNDIEAFTSGSLKQLFGGVYEQVKVAIHSGSTSQSYFRLPTIQTHPFLNWICFNLSQVAAAEPLKPYVKLLRFIRINLDSS